MAEGVTSMKYTSIALIFLIGAFGAFPVHASQFAFSQSPKDYRVVAKPDSNVILPFTLTNVGDPTVMQLRVYSLSLKDSQGSYDLIPFYSDNANMIQFQLYKSLHSLEEPFFMNTSEAIEYSLAIHIPNELSKEDYYFAVVGQTEQNKGFVNTNTLFLQGGVGSIIYISVNSDGALDQTGIISQFSVQSKHSITFGNTTYKLFDSFQDIPFVFSVSNTGLNLFSVEGTISLRSRFFGSKSELIPIDATYILAETNSILPSSKSSENRNTAVIRAPFIGIYSAQGVVKIGSSNNTQPENDSYIVFPFTYLLYTVGILILIATFVVYAKRIRSAQ